MAQRLSCSILLMAGVSLALAVCPTQANDSRWGDRVGLSIGGSYTAGSMENNGMGLPSRTMGVGSLEGLLAYKIFPNWQVGLDLDYSIVRQLTGLADAGGTNLKGHEWVLGIGTRYTFNNNWAIQGSVGLFGYHWFDNRTGSSRPDHLTHPITVRIKPQWFPFAAIPNLSLDADFRYQHWSTFNVQGTEHDQTTTQFFGGLGLTYHFGKMKGREE